MPGSIIIEMAKRFSAYILPALAISGAGSEVQARTWLETAHRATPLRGPFDAIAALIWSHGTSVNSEDSAVPAPPYMAVLRRGGSDSFRFDAVIAPAPAAYRRRSPLHARPDAHGADNLAPGFSRLFLVLSVVPLGLIGGIAALHLSDKPLGFVVLLGVLALTGMIARNSVILIDQVEKASSHSLDARHRNRRRGAKCGRLIGRL